MSRKNKESKRSDWQAPPELWKKLKPLAREMRKNPTNAERKLWQRLRRKQVYGVKFRRQMTIDRYIVDICSPSIRLIIEVDGPTHDATQQADDIRQAQLESMGFDVIRFSNRDILGNVEGAMETVYTVVDKKLTPPLPNPVWGGNSQYSPEKGSQLL